MPGLKTLQIMELESALVRAKSNSVVELAGNANNKRLSITCMWDNILVSGKNIFEVEVLDEFYAKMSVWYSKMKGRY